MLIDASVARSFSVIGWTRYLVRLSGGKILVADGVHGVKSEDSSELRRIHAALLHLSEQDECGSSLTSKALGAAHGLEQLFALGPDELAVLPLSDGEIALAVRLQSRRPEDREWRHSLGAKARRLDAGESASIAIAATRSLAFASDDEDALILWKALTSTRGWRTGDLFHKLVADGMVDEVDAKEAYGILQGDDLHNLGGPPW